MCIATRPG